MYEKIIPVSIRFLASSGFRPAYPQLASNTLAFLSAS